MIYHPLSSTYPFNTPENLIKYGPVIQMLAHDNIWIDENCVLSLEKIKSDTEKIKDLLTPLRKMGLNFELALFGGAVRDLLLKKPIKDLDYSVSFDLNDLYTFFDLTFKHNHKSLDFIESLKLTPQQGESLYYGLHSHQLPIEKRLSTFLGYFLKKENRFTSHKLYGDVSLENREFCEDLGNYPSLNVDNLLKGLIKIEDDKLHHHIDLIITNDRVDRYVKGIDFGLSQAYIKLNSLTSESSLKEYLNNFHCTPAFLDDYLHQTLTLTTQIDPLFIQENDQARGIKIAAQHMSIEHLEKAMAHYYPKLKTKYPDYQINIPKTHNDEQAYWKASFILDQQLENKEKSSVLKRKL